MFLIYVTASECICYQLLCKLRWSFFQWPSEHGYFIVGISYVFICCVNTKRVVDSFWIRRRRRGLSTRCRSSSSLIFSGQRRIEHRECRILHEEGEKPNCCTSVYTVGVTSHLKLHKTRQLKKGERDLRCATLSGQSYVSVFC